MARGPSEKRREYRDLFAKSSVGAKIQLPAKAEYRVRHIYNQFSMLVANGKRDFLKEELNKAGIGSDIYYPVPLHLQECFSYLGYKPGDMPVSEETCKNILSLPIYPESTSEQRKYVVSTIEKILA